MKICKKCGCEKPLDSFSKLSKSKDGHNNNCKICMIEYNKLHKCNPIKDQKQRENYEEISKIKHQEWYSRNKEKLKEEYKIKYKHNREEIIKRNTLHSKDYKKKRLKEDINFRLLQYLRNRIWAAVFKNNKKKQNKSIEYLGCTIEEYKYHLEQQFKEGMNWGNHGKIWEIDHIIPCNSFDLSKEEEITKCFHYTNTQPLFKSENRSKKDKILNNGTTIRI